MSARLVMIENDIPVILLSHESSPLRPRFYHAMLAALRLLPYMVLLEPLLA